MVDYSDPHVPSFARMRNYDFRMDSVILSADSLAGYDCVLLATDHDDFDYDLIARHARLIVDTRGVYQGKHDNVVKA